MIAALLLVSSAAGALPTLCWSRAQATDSAFIALEAELRNADLRSDCSVQTCRAGRSWCLRWRADERTLVVWSARTRLRRVLKFSGSSLEAVIDEHGASLVSVFIDSMALEAQLLEPDVPDVPDQPPMAPPQPIPTSTVVLGPEPPPGLPAALELPSSAFAARTSAQPQPVPGPSVRLSAEPVARFRSPGMWAPGLGIKAAYGPWFVRGRLEGRSETEEAGERLDVWGWGVDGGFDWRWVRAPRLRAGSEIGLALDGVQVSQASSESRGGGVQVGGFVGPWVGFGWGAWELSALASLSVFPVPQTVEVQTDEGTRALDIGLWGFRGGLRFAWRL